MCSELKFMKKNIILLVLILISTPCLSQQSQQAPLEIRTQDASVKTYPYQLKVNNGTLTDNGDGTATLSTGVGNETDPVWLSQKGGYVTQVDGQAYALASALSGYVPTTRTVNGKALSSNITLSMLGDIDGSMYQLGLNGTGYIKAAGTSITYDNTTYQPQHANLSSLANLATTVGNVRQTSANVFGIDQTVYQGQLSGTGYVKASGTAITYDNTTFLSGVSADSPLSGAGTSADHLIFTNPGYITAVASDSDWTVHASYPAACGANQYVSAIGDTLTCGTPASGSGTPGGANTNIQFNSNGSFGGIDKFIYNGTNIAITSSNLGIGSTAPQQKLDVEGIAYFGTGNVGIGTTGTRALLDVNGTIYATGNVGINTTAPIALLDVSGTIYGHGNVGIGTSVARKLLDVNGIIYGTNIGISTTAPVGMLDVNGTIYGHTNVGIGTSVARALLDINGTIYGTGNVGINTTAPSQTLDISGTIYGHGNVGIGTSIARKLLDVNGIIYGTNIGISTTAPIQMLDVNGIIYGHTNVGIGTSVSRWLLDVEGSAYAKGAVGIGTSIPQQFLDVNGNIYGHTNVGIGTSVARALLDVNGAVYMTGNIGIGTTSVSQLLDINGIIYGHTNVGIGTSVPRQILDVEGSLYSKGSVGIGTSIPAQLLDVNGIIYGHTNVGIGTSVSRRLLDVEGAAYMKGNVGIGTSVPRQMLEVNGAIYSSIAGNVGIGTTNPIYAVQIGTGTARATAIYADPGIYIKGSVYAEGSIYGSQANTTSGYAVCWTTTAKQLGHCTTTPTNGVCTCTNN